MKTRKKNSTHKNKNKNKNKTKKYKGGEFKPCTIPRCPEFLELKKYVKHPYTSTMGIYNGTKCDLFIWLKTNTSQSPHIHVHGFSNNCFEYTISALSKFNLKSELINTPEGYKNVLDEMCSQLNPKHRKQSELFNSPYRGSKQESSATLPPPPQKSHRPRLPEPLNLFPKKLGPHMGEFASSKNPTQSLKLSDTSSLYHTNDHEASPRDVLYSSLEEHEKGQEQEEEKGQE
jgi:hypothetical protein